MSTANRDKELYMDGSGKVRRRKAKAKPKPVPEAPEPKPPATPSLLANSTHGHLVFEIDHTKRDIINTMSLSHDELCVLRDKIDSMLTALSKRHGVKSPRKRVYLAKNPKDGGSKPLLIIK